MRFAALAIVALILPSCAPDDPVTVAHVSPAPTPAAWSEQLTADEMDRMRQINAGTVTQTPADKALVAKYDRVMAQAASRREAAQTEAWGSTDPTTLARARADCVYQAQMANVMTPGIVPGLMAGIGAGSVCKTYYRNIGVPLE